MYFWSYTHVAIKFISKHSYPHTYVEIEFISKFYISGAESNSLITIVLVFWLHSTSAHRCMMSFLPRLLKLIIQLLWSNPIFLNHFHFWIWPVRLAFLRQLTINIASNIRSFDTCLEQNVFDLMRLCVCACEQARRRLNHPATRQLGMRGCWYAWYVWMYVCMHVCMYVCMYAYMCEDDERCLLITESPKTPGHYRYLIWVLECMYVCIYLSMHVCMHVSMYVSMYVCMNVCMYDVCMYECMYVS